MKRSQQLEITKALADIVKDTMVNAIKAGKIPESWDGFELRGWMREIVISQIDYRPLSGKRKKEFKNHLIITPGIV